jgi:glycosyltransferase involved in cell wall biosynthesis
MDRALVRRADLVMVWSAEYEDWVQQVYGIARTAQMPAGVDFTLFDNHDTAIRDKLKAEYSEQQHLLLINAMLTAKKRVDLLILALAALKSRGVSVTALVIGEGELRGELEALAEELGVAENLVLLGYVSQEALPCYHFIVDLLLYLEPRGAWSLSIIEAAAARLPVIAAPGGSMETLVKHGQTGIMLEEEADADTLAKVVSSLLEQSQTRQAMGEANRQLLSRYSLENMAQQFLDLVTAP